MATHTIRLDPVASSNATPPAYSVERVEGDSRFTARIVDVTNPAGKGVEVTGPDVVASDVSAKFRVTILVRCTANSIITDTVTQEFTVTRRATANRAPMLTMVITSMRFETTAAAAQIRSATTSDADGDPVTLRASSSDTEVATVDVVQDAMDASRWGVEVSPVGAGTTVITVIPNDGKDDGAARVFTVTVADPCANTNVELQPITNKEYSHGSGPHTIIPGHIVHGVLALSIARRSGSAEISAAIVRDQIVVTVPSAANRNVRSAVFRLTGVATCASDATRTDTDTTDFTVTVPAGSVVVELPGIPGLAISRVADDVTATITAPTMGGAPTGYELQRSGTSDFMTVEETRTPNAASFEQFLDLSVGAHYWRARAVNSAGEGPWSIVRSAVVPQLIPNAPTVQVVGGTGQITFTVVAPAAGPTPFRYEVQIDNNEDFTNAVVGSSISVIHPPPSPSGTRTRPGGTTYVRARSVRGDGTRSAWSDVVSAAVAAVQGAPNAPGLTATKVDEDTIRGAVTAPSAGTAPTSYQVQVSRDSGFLNDLQTKRITEPGDVDFDINMVYRVWHMRARGLSPGRGGRSVVGPWSPIRRVNLDPQPMVTYSPSSPGPGDVVEATLSSTAEVSDYFWQRRTSDGARIWNISGSQFDERELTLSDTTPVGRQYRVAWRRTGVGFEYGPWLTVADVEPQPPGLPKATAPNATISVGGVGAETLLQIVVAGGHYDEISYLWDDGTTTAFRRVNRPESGTVGYTATVTVKGTGTNARDETTATVSVAVTVGPSTAEDAMVVYSSDMPEQGEDVTAMLPAGATGIRWQGLRDNGVWQNVVASAGGTATFSIPDRARVGIMYRVTWQVGSTQYIASNAVTVVAGTLDPNDVPTGLKENGFDETSSDFSDWTFRAAWDWPKGAVEAQREVETYDRGIRGGPLVQRDATWTTYSQYITHSIGNLGGIPTDQYIGSAQVNRWRVRVRNDDESVTTGWSAWRYIAYANVPATPPGVPTAVFRWRNGRIEAAVAAAADEIAVADYEVQISASSTFASILATKTRTTAGTVTFPDQDTPSTRYYLRARSRNSRGNSAWLQGSVTVPFSSQDIALGSGGFITAGEDRRWFLNPAASVDRRLMQNNRAGTLSSIVVDIYSTADGVGVQVSLNASSDLISAWETNPNAIRLTNASGGRIIIPGPASSGVVVPDSSDPYTWQIEGRTFYLAVSRWLDEQSATTLRLSLP